jgi:hypothetical protein
MTIDELKYYAEGGCSSQQYFLAAAIYGDPNYPNRRLEAYKWVVISKWMGDAMATECVLDFIYWGLTSDEKKRAFDLVDEWWEEKFSLAHDEDVDPESLDWHQALQDKTGLTERKTKIKLEQEKLSRDELRHLMTRFVREVKASYDGLPVDDLDHP